MSEQSPERPDDEAAAEQQKHGSFSVEDDPDGTTDPAELAGTATTDDQAVTYQPEFSEADGH